MDDRGAATIKVTPRHTPREIPYDVKTPYTDEPDEPGAERRRARKAAAGLAGRLADADQRARLTPPALIAGTVASGHLLDGSPVLAFGAAALTAATIAAARLMRRRTTTSLAYAAITSGYAGSWAAGIASHGITWDGPADAYMLAGAVILSAPVAWKHRWKYQPAEDTITLPEPVDLPKLVEITEFQEIWKTYVDCPDRPGRGMALTPEWEIPGGHQADILVPRGSKSTQDAINLAPLIASAYDKAPTQVIVEATPDRKATRARLTVLDRDVLAAPRVWAGSTLDPATGRCVVGTFPDAALAHWRFWTPGSGASHGLIAGAPGTGKSRFNDKLQAEIHKTPLIVSWILDPQEGQSLPDWEDAVGRFVVGSDGDVDDIMEALRALRRITFRRSAFFSPKNYRWTDDKGRERGGKKHFDPTPEMPLLVATLEEAHAVVKNPDHGEEALSILGDIGKLGRKAGVGLILVNQLPSLEELGGSKAQVVRAMLRGGNVVSFRTGESVSQYMLGLASDPSQLPSQFADGSETQGLGLIAGVDKRDAPFRAEYIHEPFDVACEPAAGRLDAMSLEAAEAHDDPDLAPKSFTVQGFKATPLPTKAQRQNWADKILPLFADGQPREFGQVWKAFPADTSDRSIRYGLDRLVERGLLHTEGRKKPYVITDEGRAALGLPVPVVA